MNLQEALRAFASDTTPYYAASKRHANLAADRIDALEAALRKIEQQRGVVMRPSSWICEHCGLVLTTPDPWDFRHNCKAPRMLCHILPWTYTDAEPEEA